ncbi:hypothetical protein HPB48_006293 [Haemaphysalis longicornis]|uniref:Globin domain-containing protein n=1 Tax=Haemaphysalis longicornis TaxID=44386 RepID=A0A9J6GSP5_HAELO|nr:hypothetical protein HPB48_006293 [Haemaphysalis longicornis]
MGNVSHKPAVPDPQTGLTPRQVKLIQSTWQMFCSSHREYGVLLFVALFTKHPHLLDLFPKFRDKDIATLMDKPVFRAHACAIGYHITSMVASLEDAAALKIMAQRVGAEHLRRNGVTPAHFEVLGDCLVDVLVDKDKRDMTVEAIQAWREFITVSLLLVALVFSIRLSFCVSNSTWDWKSYGRFNQLKSSILCKMSIIV